MKKNHEFSWFLHFAPFDIFTPSTAHTSLPADSFDTAPKHPTMCTLSPLYAQTDCCAVFERVRVLRYRSGLQYPRHRHRRDIRRGERRNTFQQASRAYTNLCATKYCHVFHIHQRRYSELYGQVVLRALEQRSSLPSVDHLARLRCHTNQKHQTCILCVVSMQRRNQERYCRCCRQCVGIR